MMRARFAQLLEGALRLGSCRSGSAAVESAFILPVLLLVLLGVFEMGRIAWTQSSLTFAVQEAARCASVRPDLCGTSAAVSSYAAKRAAGLSIPASAFTLTTQTCGKQVRGEVEHRIILYPIFNAAPKLSAQHCRA